MTPTTLVRVAGVLGGSCWLARAILDSSGGPDALVNGLHWGGLALIGLALLGLGAALVSGLPALRVVVAICLVVLAWSVVEMLHSQYADRGVDGLVGALVVVFSAVGLVRGRGRHDAEGRPTSRSSGSHAA